MEKTILGVPTKRFSEFNDEWRAGWLGDIATTVTSGSRDWAQYYADEGSKFIRMTNLPREGIQLLLNNLKFVKLNDDSSEGKRTSLQENDILFSITAELGKIGIIPPDLGAAYINQHTALIRLNPERTDARFVAHKLSSKEMNNKINRLNDAGAKAGLNLSTIRAIPISLPTLPEQKKIADFLTSVDDRIGQLIKKKTLLEDYKKGVMQQLFSQKIRFKDDNGNDFPDWEEKKFLEVMKTVSPRGHQIESSAILPEGVFRVIDQGKVKVAGYCNDPNRVMADIPVIVFGDHTTTIKYIDFEFVVGADGTKILTSKSAEHELKYFYYNLVHNNVPQEGYKRHFSILKEISLQVPSNDEQTKIADFLSSIDQKIESVSHQIAKTQTFKKGLLQQMFV